MVLQTQAVLHCERQIAQGMNLPDPRQEESAGASIPSRLEASGTGFLGSTTKPRPRSSSQLAGIPGQKKRARLEVEGFRLRGLGKRFSSFEAYPQTLNPTLRIEVGVGGIGHLGFQFFSPGSQESKAVTYQNLLFCRVPINPMLGFIMRTYKKVGLGSLR